MTPPDRPPTAVLLISCPDRAGLVHAVAEFVLGQGGNILHVEQHIDTDSGVFFQRVEFAGDGLDPVALEAAFAPVAAQHGMSFQVRSSADRPRIALLASRDSHCLADLLARWRAGALNAEVVAVVSNHPDHAGLAQFHQVPYHHLPVTAATKDSQEQQILDVLAAAEVDLVVLARYMQVLSPRLLDAYPERIINIHHSFLPAFAGAKPYHQAYRRGVKIVGATAHYATADLDEGPIISQDVAHVSHRDTAADMIAKGRDLETVVLARAVRAHLAHRTLVFGNKTVVFG